MSPQLLDLSQELILQIVELLREAEKDSEAKESDDEIFANLESDEEGVQADGRIEVDSQVDHAGSDEITDDASDEAPDDASGSGEALDNASQIDEAPHNASISEKAPDDAPGSGTHHDSGSDEAPDDASRSGEATHDASKSDETTHDASNGHSSQAPGSQHNDGGQAFKVAPAREQDILNLSRTCTFFYKILSPYLFRSITLRNTQKSGVAVQYLCSTSQVAYGKTLHFMSTAPGEWKPNFGDVEAVFPPEVKSVLSNLSEFPYLETLVIDFDFHLNEEEGYEHWEDLLYYLAADDDDETVEEIEKAEEQEGWRALIKKTFEAICMDASNGTRELIVKDCPIRANSVLGSDRFNKWLEKLDSFKFEIYGADTGAGWLVNTAPRFQRYMGNLDHYFLNALANVTRLAIIGHEEAAIGQTEFHEAPIPLKGGHMPKLRELEMGYWFVQYDTLDFLVAHSTTLEHIVFNHCFLPSNADAYESSFEDSDQPMGEPERTWNTWFQTYASKQPRALHRITFKPHNALMFDTYNMPKRSVVTKTRLLLDERKAEGKEHRVFPYGSVDDKYGYLSESENCNRIRACKGQDLEGWYALRDVMESNSERLRGQGAADLVRR